MLHLSPSAAITLHAYNLCGELAYAVTCRITKAPSSIRPARIVVYGATISSSEAALANETFERGAPVSFIFADATHAASLLVELSERARAVGKRHA